MEHNPEHTTGGIGLDELSLADVDWIAEGTRFTVDDFVHFAGRGERPLGDALPDVDLIITGPHASAAIPAELKPFIDHRLTKRLQYDFTDVSTSPVARRWAELDRRVLYVENPHPRLVRDANRARPQDVLAGVREAFHRLARAAAGARPSLEGVDAVRPVTFGYLPVLRRPETDAEWQQLGDALAVAGSLGVDEYERIRDELIQQVIEAKLRRLAELDPTTTTVADWNSATNLDVLSFHDTMNHTARPDGALNVERAPVDRLPNVVSLANRGDASGCVAVNEEPTVRLETAVPTMDPARLRSIGHAYRSAFNAWESNDVAYNRPYTGGHETQTVGPMLRRIEPCAVVRSSGSPARELRLGAWQNEFLREFLLGPEATEHLQRPGSDWVLPPPERVDWLAERLRTAHDLVRRWGVALDRGVLGQ